MKRFISSILAIAMMFTLLGTVTPFAALADTTDGVSVLYDEDFSEDTYTKDTNWITGAGTATNLPTGWSIGAYNGGPGYNGEYSASNSVKVIADPTGSSRGNVLEIVPDNNGYAATIGKKPATTSNSITHEAGKGLYLKQSMYIDKDTAAGLIPGGDNHSFLLSLQVTSPNVTRASGNIGNIYPTKVENDKLTVGFNNKMTALDSGNKAISTSAVSEYTLDLNKWIDIEYYIDIPGIKATTVDSTTTYELKYHLWIDGAYVTEFTVSTNNSTPLRIKDSFYGVAFMPAANAMRTGYTGSTVKPIVYVDDLKAAYVPATDASTMSVTVNADNSKLTASFTGGTLYNTTADLKDNVAILDATGIEVSGAVTSALVKNSGAALEVAVTGLSSGAAYTLKLKDGITNSNRISLAGKTADFVTTRVATPLTYLYDEDFSEDTYTVDENWITAAGTADKVPTGWTVAGYNAKTYSKDNSIKVVKDPTDSSRGNVLEIIPAKDGYAASINTYPGPSSPMTHETGKGLYLKQSMYIDKETASGLIFTSDWYSFLLSLPITTANSRASGSVANIYPTEVENDKLIVKFNDKMTVAACLEDLSKGNKAISTSAPEVSEYTIDLDKWIDIEYYIDIPGIKATNVDSTTNTTTYELKYYLWIDGAYVTEFTVSTHQSNPLRIKDKFRGVAFMPAAYTGTNATVQPKVYIDDVKAAYVAPLTLKSQEVDENTVTFTFSDLIKPLVSTTDVFTVTDSTGEVVDNAVTSVSVVDDKLTVTLDSALSGVYTFTPIANVIRADSEAAQTYTAPVTVTLLPDITVSDVTYSVSGTTCTVNYTITNNTAAPANYTAIAAVYNANEGLIGVTVLPAASLAANTPVTDSANVAFDGTISTVRFFVWDNLTSVSPLADATDAVIATAQQ